jgi:hypothetical protein
MALTGAIAIAPAASRQAVVMAFAFMGDSSACRLIIGIFGCYRLQAS